MDELQRISPDTLRMERLLDAPVEKVWRWPVEPELRVLRVEAPRVLSYTWGGGSVPDFWALHSLSKARVAAWLAIAPGSGT